jgi:hypothetical protein
MGNKGPYEVVEPNVVSVLLHWYSVRVQDLSEQGRTQGRVQAHVQFFRKVKRLEAFA